MTPSEKAKSEAGEGIIEAIGFVLIALYLLAVFIIGNRTMAFWIKDHVTIKLGEQHEG